MNKLMFGLIAGFVTGILVAPDKGSVTRKKIKSSFDGLVDDCEKCIRDIVDKTKDISTPQGVAKMSTDV